MSNRRKLPGEQAKPRCPRCKCRDFSTKHGPYNVHVCNRCQHIWAIAATEGDSLSTYRRLLVIDTESPNQIERLLTDLRSMSFAARACGARTCLQQALRAMLEPPQPPKPDEPPGLGAVVRDASGCEYLRTFGDAGFYVWRRSTDFERNRFRWSDIDAVEVLSGGVTA